MKIKAGMEQEYQTFLNENSVNGHSGIVVRYMERWAEMMEAELEAGASLKDIAKRTSYAANTDQLSLFQYGIAVSKLSHFWLYGEELQLWQRHRYDEEPQKLSGTENIPSENPHKETQPQSNTALNELSQQAVETVVQKGLLETKNGGWHLDRAAFQELTGIGLSTEKGRDLFFDALNKRPEVISCFYDYNCSGIGIEFDHACCPNLEETAGMEIRL